MFNQAFGDSNYCSYNIRIANLFGLEAAVYLNCILSLDGISNNKDGNILVNREGIKNITTLTYDAQRNLDKLFNKVSVFNIIDSNELSIDYSHLLSLFNSDYENIVYTEAPKIKESTKKKTKSEAIKDELRRLIKTDNPQLRDAYSDWIDAVFAKQGWMSKKSVTLGQSTIDSFCNGDINKAISVLNIASINGYRDIQWAINTYEANKNEKKKNNLTFNTEFKPKDKIDLAQEVF